MFACFDFLRELTVLGVSIRILLALLCGGMIGIERAEKRRPAGFRTHILICLGAAITAMTSEHLFLTMHYYLDVARMGAGVVSGIGFIGAGTIMVTRRQRVKGLTTAAGLWVVAIVGLCCGFGFYEGAVYTTVLVLMAEIFSPSWSTVCFGTPKRSPYTPSTSGPPAWRTSCPTATGWA